MDMYLHKFGFYYQHSLLYNKEHMHLKLDRHTYKVKLGSHIIQHTY